MELNINKYYIPASLSSEYLPFYHGDIQIEVNEIINSLGASHISAAEFCQILLEKNSESDLETDYKVGWVERKAC